MYKYTAIVRKFVSGTFQNMGLLTMLAVLVFGIGFLSPYFMKNKPAYAVTVAPSMCPIPAGTCGCALFGQGYTVQTALDYALQQLNAAIIKKIQDFIRQKIIDAVGRDILASINDILEGGTRGFLEQTWEEQMRPSLQSMTSQLHTLRTDQTRMIGSFFDAQNLTFIQNKIGQAEIDAGRKVKPSELICMAATQAGGFSRANTFVRGMRFGMEDEKQNTGINAAGSIGGRGKDAIQNYRWTTFINVFCDSRLNAGNLCVANGTRPNADIMPTSTLLNPLTINMKNAPDRLATEFAMENLAGFDVLDPVRPASINTESGEKEMLKKRALLAKRAAARSVNTLTSIGWRTRGSNMSAWVNEFNQKTGSQIPVSADPSYREVMHAVTKYKFLSGQYGAEQVQDPLNIEREKLIASSLYLMQLRDYFELLERVTLIAAVDTSMMLYDYVNSGGGYQEVLKPR